MTTESVLLEPVVSWPREAAPGGRYLITVDLRSGGMDEWPYENEEEYPVGVMVTGKLGLTVETLGDASVVLHRFGGTYGAARFVVTVGVGLSEGKPTELRLTLLSAGGVPFHSVRLPIRITHSAPVWPEVADIIVPRFLQGTVDHAVWIRFTDADGAMWEYDENRLIGSGGFGRVFSGRSVADGRAVAVKRLEATTGHRIATVREHERTVGELFSAARRSGTALSHVVPTLGYSSVDAEVFIVMPLADESLAHALGARALPLAEGLTVIGDVARGLAELEALGVVHRNIKPDSILRFGDVWKIGDLGIADLTGYADDPFEGFGTPLYMAPEVWSEKPVTARSDLYALGIVAYEIFAGEPPFTGSMSDLRRQHASAPPAVIAGLPPKLTRLIVRLLAKDPADRPPDARAVVEMIDGLARQLVASPEVDFQQAEPQPAQVEVRADLHHTAVPEPPGLGAAGNWQARISDEYGRTLGAGVLISARHVLTCAHVVGPMLDRPTSSYLVDFPRSQRLEPIVARVAADGWFPETPTGQRDIAVLTLDETPAGDIRPAPLGRAATSFGSNTRVLGHPPEVPEGVWGHFIVSAPAGSTGERVEVVPATGQSPVGMAGFSGAGVLDESSDRVVGVIVTALLDSAAATAAWMIPIEVVARYWTGIAGTLPAGVGHEQQPQPALPQRRLSQVGTVRVGFTGQARLSPSAYDLVHRELATLLQRLPAVHGVINVATGPAQLFAAAVQTVGGTFEVVLPAGDDQLPPDLEPLLAEATTVLRAPGADAWDDRLAAANRLLFERCDQLVAVWDGTESAEPGGPARMVALARQRDLPVTVVWPAGTHIAPAPVRVFISYAPDSEEHVEAVRQLWLHLRENGVDARLDLAMSDARSDWPSWMSRELAEADYVVVVASPGYRRRVDDGIPGTESRGVHFEIAQMRELLSRNRGARPQGVLPVVLPGGSSSDLPTFVGPLSDTVQYVPEMSPAGLASLLQRILGVSNLSLPPVRNLSVRDLGDLVDALLDLPYFASPLVRERIVELLPPAIRRSVVVGPTARMHTLSIIRACARAGSDGRDALLGVLRLVASPDDSRVRTAVDRIAASPIFS